MIEILLAWKRPVRFRGRLTLRQKMTPVGSQVQENSDFGYSVATNIGNTLVYIGQPNFTHYFTGGSHAQAGTVHLFRRAPTQNQHSSAFSFTWTSTSPLQHAGFSITSSAAGGMVAHGAPHHHESSGIRKGYIYLHRFDVSTSNVPSTLGNTVSSGYVQGQSFSENAEFGYKLTSDTGITYLASAAPNALNGSIRTGLVNFYKSNGEWNGISFGLKSQIAPPSPQNGERFGHNMKMTNNGNFLFIASPFKNNGNGVVYAYKLVSENYVHFATINSPENETDQNFGLAIGSDPSGKNVLISSPNKTVDGKAKQGVVYQFLLDDSTQTYNLFREIQSSNGAAGDRFGYAIGGVLGSTEARAFIGAPYKNTGASASGAFYTFDVQADKSYEENDYIIPPVPYVNGRFGFCFDANTTFLVVGSPGDSEMATGCGAVFSYAFNLNYI